MNDKEAILKRARDYPYDSPRGSFLYQDGEILEFHPDQITNRIPVLAFGSNKAPTQLQRKFGHLPNSIIPVEAVTLHDFDVVFAAHVTSYGSIPAMLQHCPNVEVKIAITWLDEAQLEVMHQTELSAANYAYAKLENIKLIRSNNNAKTEAFAYVGKRGHLLLSPKNTNGIAISDIHAKNRTWEEKTTAEILSILHQQNDAGFSEDDFIFNLIKDHDFRSLLTDAISENECHFNYPYDIVYDGVLNIDV